jgi:hypothetical protein
MFIPEFAQASSKNNSIEHQGTVSGNTIELKSYGPGGEFDVTLKRVTSGKKSAQQ